MAKRSVPCVAVAVVLLIVMATGRCSADVEGPTLLIRSPSPPQQQPISGDPGSAIRVRISPKRAVLHYGQTVTFRCTARGGVSAADMPFIRFSMMFEPDTVMPLSTGIPGVNIETEPTSGNYSLQRYNTVTQKLTIGNEMYEYMRYGENKFSCRAVNLNRDQQKQFFSIIKV